MRFKILRWKLLLVLLTFNGSCYESSALELERVAEISGVFASRILDVRASHDNGNQAVVMAAIMREPHEVNTQEYLASIKEVLIPWRGESSVLVDGNDRNHFVIDNDNILALSNLHDGTFYEILSSSDGASLKLLSKKRNAADLNELLPSISLVSHQVAEVKFDVHGNEIGLEAPEARKNQVDGFERSFRTPKTHILPEGDVLLLIRANASLKLQKVSKEGSLLWNTTLMPSVKKESFVYRPWQYLAVSASGNAAVAFYINPDERASFQKLHDIVLPSADHGDDSHMIAVFIVDSNGRLLKTHIFQESSIDGLSWADSSTVVAVFTRSEKEQHLGKIAVIKTTEDVISYLLFSFGSEPFKINSVVAATPDRILIGGSIGFDRVRTGSLVSGGKGVIALYDLSQKGFIAFKKIGTVRDNSVTAIESIGSHEFLMATSEDGPLTHDEGNDQRSKSVLYRVRIK